MLKLKSCGRTGDTKTFRVKGYGDSDELWPDDDTKCRSTLQAPRVVGEAVLACDSARTATKKSHCD